jgi:hypothetical protein
MKHYLAKVFQFLGLVFHVLYLVFPLILVLSIVGMMGSCVAGCTTMSVAERNTGRSKGMDYESEKQVGNYFFFMYMCFMTALISGGITWLLTMITNEIENNK